MPDSLRSGPLDKQKQKNKTMNMKKLSVLLLAAAVLFSSCGQPTYDIDNPEESSAEMVKNLSAEEKVAFARAAYSLTLQYQVALLELADKGGSTDIMNDGKNMSLSEYRRSVDLKKAMKKFTKNNGNKASLKLFPVRNAAAAKGRFPASWDAAEH